MSTRGFWAGGAVSLTILCSSVFTFAQNAPGGAQRDFEIRKITQDLMVAPDYQGMLRGSSKGSAMSQKWLRIEAEFESQPEWADDVTLKYYVLLGEGKATRMFVGEVTHVNVRKDRRHYSALFMHPNAVDRYGGGKKPIVAIHLLHQNKLMDIKGDPEPRERWWERFTPTQGYLVSALDTPWSIVSFDRYEAIKPATR